MQLSFFFAQMMQLTLPGYHPPINMVDVAPAVFETFAVCDRVMVRRITLVSLVNLGFAFNQMAKVAVFVPFALRLAEDDVVH